MLRIGTRSANHYDDQGTAGLVSLKPANRAQHLKITQREVPGVRSPGQDQRKLGFTTTRVRDAGIHNNRPFDYLM